MNESEVAVAGIGYIGERHARIWSDYGHTAYLLDTHDQAKELADRLGSQLVVLPETGWEDQVTDLAKRVNVLDICTPVNTHGDYMKAALAGGVRKIFVEKPSTEHPNQSREILEAYPDALIQVDYVEREHPAVLTLTDEMLRTGFIPTNFFNWRSHDVRALGDRVKSGDLTKVTLSHLIHDISEIDYFLNHTNNISLVNQHPTVVQSTMTSWTEKYGDQYPDYPDGDVSTDFTLDIQGIMARVRGDGDSRYVVEGEERSAQRRYFVVYNDDQAYFGQTLGGMQGREGIHIAAAVANGATNARRMVELCEEGNIFGNEDYDNLFKETKAEVLDMSRYPLARRSLEGMIANLHRAKTIDDLVCPLSSAISFEEIGIQVYKKAGRLHFLES